MQTFIYTPVQTVSVVAEELFRRLAQKLGVTMLLKKGELHALVPSALMIPAAEAEVRSKLDLLGELFQPAQVRGEQVVGDGALANSDGSID